jgi:mono/diheme cytochrome c family protein
MRDGWWCRRRARALLFSGLAMATGFCSVRSAFAAPPVVPGYSVLTNAKASDVDRGQLLLGELNCVACHKAEGAVRVEGKGAPELANAGARLTPQFLTAYLSDPHGIKPGATMPDVFHAS